MRSGIKDLCASALICLTASACATVREPWGMSAANDSSNSSQGSGDSSQGSGDSSKSSGESSGNSAQSFNNTGHSSEPGGSSDLNASSKNSSAESSANTSRSTGNSTYVVSAVGLSTGTLAAIGVAIYFSVKAAQPPVGATALRFLRANEDQLRQDLALGAGPALEDLAAAAEIRRAHAPRFYALLHQNRAELLELAEPSKLDEQRALLFLSAVGEYAQRDEVLKEDVAGFLARHPTDG